MVSYAIGKGVKGVKGAMCKMCIDKEYIGTFQMPWGL